MKKIISMDIFRILYLITLIRSHIIWRKGQKLKVSFKNYQIENNANTFKNFSVDLSHHQPISENIIFSSRLYYGNSFGENPYKYMLGGVKNSLIRKFEDKGVNDPLF